jgi:Txe/YoeB family toxin of toxin-antitoxin system
VSWRVVFTTQALRDAKKVESGGLRPHVEVLLDLIADDPFGKPPPFERLVGGLAGTYSRRINIHNRLVYEVIPDARAVKVLRMWTHND